MYIVHYLNNNVKRCSLQDNIANKSLFLMYGIEGLYIEIRKIDKT